MLEIEQKFRVVSLESVRVRLQELGAVPISESTEHDTYFKHPVRDFATTDEAFRLRSIGDKHVVTYKGPRSGGEVKTRREIELPIGGIEHARDDVVALITALSFEPVADVRKQRTSFRVNADGRLAATVTLDLVDRLSPHAEVEVVTDDVAAGESAVRHFADLLGLQQLENRSYLELVLAQSVINTEQNFTKTH